MVGGDQFGVDVQARYFSSCVHVEFAALECAEHLEFLGQGLATHSFGLHLHLQLEFFFLFQNPVHLLALLPLWQRLFHGFLCLIVIDVFGFVIGIFDHIFLFDPTLLLRQESEPFVQSDYVVDFRFYDNLQCDPRQKVELLWIW